MGTGHQKYQQNRNFYQAVKLWETFIYGQQIVARQQQRVNFTGWPSHWYTGTLSHWYTGMDWMEISEKEFKYLYYIFIYLYRIREL